MATSTITPTTIPATSPGERAFAFFPADVVGSASGDTLAAEVFSIVSVCVSVSVLIVSNEVDEVVMDRAEALLVFGEDELDALPEATPAGRPVGTPCLSNK